MKIYPYKGAIVGTDKINPSTDIPLSYLHMKEDNYNITFEPIITEQETKRMLIPYDKLDFQDLYLFNKAGEKIPNHLEYILRDKDEFYYMPKEDYISFDPQTFNPIALIKKSLKYKSSSLYNISVSCCDDDNLTLSKNLIQIFGDAAKRKVAPPNIFINNEDTQIESLINSMGSNSDVVFLEHNESHQMPIDLSYNNLWIICDTFEDENLLKISENFTNSFSDPLILKKDMEFSFSKGFVIQKESVNDHEKYINLFSENKTPIVIKENTNENKFYIISTKEIFNNIVKYANLIYEVLFYIYSNSYISYDLSTTWITDTVPDYVVINNTLTTNYSFSSKIDINKNWTSDEYKIIDVYTFQNNIGYNIVDKTVGFYKLKPGEFTPNSGPLLSATKPEDIQLKLDPIMVPIGPSPMPMGSSGSIIDPVKPEGYISIYTSKHSVMYVGDLSAYLIENKIQDHLSISNSGDKYFAEIRNFKSSKYMIDCPYQSIEIHPIINLDYIGTTKKNKLLYLCCKNNIFYIYNADEINSFTGTIFGKIHIEFKEEYELYDMRLRGGGIPKSEEKNYNLMDIGNINGRPFRKGGAVIITLPSEYKNFKDKIEEAVKKHMIAEAYPIIIFEGDDLNE